MNKYDLKHLSDDEVLIGFAAVVAKERASKTKLRNALAEVDRRGLKVPAGLAVPREELADLPAAGRVGAKLPAPGRVSDEPSPTVNVERPLPEGGSRLVLALEKSTHDKLRRLQTMLRDAPEELVAIRAIEFLFARLENRTDLD